MKCKDCIYFKRCVVLGVELDMKHDKEADKNCRHFKNKADFVEVKHGEWKKIVKDIGKGRTITYYQCSLCDVYIPEKTNYCYHCGAKMDGKQQKEGD